SRRRHTRFSRDWSSDVCSSDLHHHAVAGLQRRAQQDVFTGEPRREAEPVPAPLDARELRLKRGARRVGAPGVLIAVAELPDPVQIGRASGRESRTESKSEAEYT